MDKERSRHPLTGSIAMIAELLWRVQQQSAIASSEGRRVLGVDDHLPAPPSAPSDLVSRPMRPNLEPEASIMLPPVAGSSGTRVLVCKKSSGEVFGVGNPS